jgi:hypothetical protein
MATQPIRGAKRRNAPFGIALAAASTLASPRAQADANDTLAGLFDAVAGVPFAKTMLGIVRADERVPTTPAVLDQRLRAVEQLLSELNGRLQLLEVRADQLQVEEAKTQNLARLREYQRLIGAITLINTELQTHPTDRGRRVVLAATARQLADSIRDTPSFDLWMWTDIDTQTHLLRTRFHDTPTFEVYSLAVTTWFTTLSVLYGDRPLALIGDEGPALQKHAEFLRVRSAWRDQVQPPVELPEYLHTTVFCRPVAIQKFADQNGSCRFGTECLDNIDGKMSAGDEFTLNMGEAVPGAPTLCTWDPNRQWNFPQEQKLRDDHGEALMTAMADALEKFATTGSQASQFVGTFPDWVMSPIYSVPLNQPFQAPVGSKLGAVPLIAKCSDFNGCSLPATNEAYWQLAISSQAHFVRNKGTSLCLDVNNNAVGPGATLVMWSCNGSPTQNWEKRPATPGHWRLASAHSNFCVTVPEDPPPPGIGRIGERPRSVQPQRSVLLETCGTNPRQEFANTDNTPLRGPN